MIRRDAFFVLLISAVFAAGTYVMYRVAGEGAVLVAVTASFALLLTVMAAIFRRNERRFESLVRMLERRFTDAGAQRQDLHRQSQALLALYNALTPTAPLPDIEGWAACPDFLKKAIDVATDMDAAEIVECGSGTSTLVLAYYVKRRGEGKVTSLEHDPEYAERTRSLLRQHGVEAQATVVDAPLRSYELRGTSWRWYDLDAVQWQKPIDFLVIDGPPKAVQTKARFPAVPLLHERFRPGVKILMDDADRADETALVQDWLELYPGFSAESISTQKGAVLICVPDGS